MSYSIIIIILNMLIQSPVDIIGKNIDEIPKCEINKDLDVDRETGIKSYQSEAVMSFLGENFEDSHIDTDANGKIINVSFSIFKTLSNPDYFSEFIKEFGEPDASFCIDKLTDHSESKGDMFTFSSAYATMKECDYRENSPTYNIWKLKENCFIRVTHPFTNPLGIATFPRLSIEISSNNFEIF